MCVKAKENGGRTALPQAVAGAWTEEEHDDHVCEWVEIP